jgi:molybdate transport system substrate-binding protein
VSGRGALAAAAAGIVALAAALAAAGCGFGGGDASAAEEELLVAAASDLRYAFEELGGLFEEETGTRVTFSFGSSGQLARQLIEGAPFDVFASANVSFVDEVVDAGRGDPATKATYALGRIVVWARDRELRLEELGGESVGRVAIANPEHAPYGLAARQALESAGLWEPVEPKLVYGENVSDTHRLASSGNVDAAISALSLALAPGDDGRWTLVPVHLHEPLEQALVVSAPDARAATARAFVDVVGSPAGREVMRSYGFLLPGDPQPEE